MCATYMFNITVIITHPTPTLRTRGPGFVRNRDLYIYKYKSNLINNLNNMTYIL
uniref:Putative uncharacterized protein Q0017, mitochondrial n=1 Tax=Saccharomyces cerevisiae (strain ATCC 204508 / S288c) TaxID=559292 RepID=Q0017_YEAST|nr:RecName: Full=Putative uncharacterized protein Q0017, mitochondrial [Saccharomyces cerevisiae S288C]